MFCSDDSLARVRAAAPYARPMTPRPVQHGGGVELDPVLHSIRTAVSASPESRLRRSPLRGETRRRSALFVASTARSLAESHQLLDRLLTDDPHPAGSSVLRRSETGVLPFPRRDTVVRMTSRRKYGPRGGSKAVTCPDATTPVRSSRRRWRAAGHGDRQPIRSTAVTKAKKAGRG